MAGEPETYIFLALYIVASAGFTAFGVYTLRHSERVATFFRSAASRIYGDRFSRRVYTARGLRLAGAAFVVMGPLFVLVGLYILVGTALGWLHPRG